MREGRTKITKVPHAPRREFAPKQNRQLPAQTRKMLGRHYAARYRVR